MNIFIGWAGEDVKPVAIALRRLLAELDADLQPWVSEADIALGSRWEAGLTSALENARCGVFCLSRSSMRSPWVMFEAGVLSTPGAARLVCPYLVGVARAELPPPLGQFQACEATKEGTAALVVALKEALRGAPLSSDEKSILETNVRERWPALGRQVHAARLPPEYNRLDDRGLCDLLDIHFTASSAALMDLFQEQLRNVHGDVTQINKTLLRDLAHGVLTERRGHLEPFYNDRVRYVDAFLNDHLPQDVLNSVLDKGIEMLSQSADREGKLKDAFGLIRKMQVELEKDVRANLFAGMPKP